ncbi:hypothetical protein PHLCEN_2v3327 [Hermanssonia centrifuga]|uniref:Uncharacterized protein n=1 Tax=Hermanssonia centrifuga TaxID=98765 RepID=A0A2R6QM85_9APHY|nr:hypothetical protein PHLCEN_2v3327 [Hermanssonia centrifuga]
MPDFTSSHWNVAHTWSRIPGSVAPAYDYRHKAWNTVFSINFHVNLSDGRLVDICAYCVTLVLYDRTGLARKVKVGYYMVT